MSSILTGSTTSPGIQGLGFGGSLMVGPEHDGTVEAQMAVEAGTRTIRILLFGRLGEALGREVTIDIPAQGCSVGDLRSELRKRNPGLEALDPARAKACVDHVLVGDEHRLGCDEEVAFLPPLSGG